MTQKNNFQILLLKEKEKIFRFLIYSTTVEWIESYYSYDTEK